MRLPKPLLLVSVLVSISILSLNFAGFFTAQAGAADAANIGDQAAKFFQEKSYTQAAALWEQQLAREKPVPGTPRDRELSFRIADAQWRTLASAKEQDQTAYEPSLKNLRALAQTDPADCWAAEASESLGDQILAGQPWWGMKMGKVRESYDRALAFWENSDDMESARQRYLRIVFGYLNRFDRVQLPSRYAELWSCKIAENALVLARTPEEMAQANFLLAGALQVPGKDPSPALWKRIRAAFASALAVGKKNPRFDDVLYAAAQWAEIQGRLVEAEPGKYQSEPDYADALRLYKILLRDYGEGESRWFKEADSRVKEISSPVLEIDLGSAFLPGSPIEFKLTGRNAGAVEMSLAKLDLAKAMTLKGEEKQRESEPGKKPDGVGAVVRTWSIDTGGAVPYEPFAKWLRTEALPPGAYWLQARAKGIQFGATLIVTKAAISMKGFPHQLLVFVCDAMTGEPLGEGRVQVLQYMTRSNGKIRFWETRIVSGEINREGVARIDVPELPVDGYDEGFAAVATVQGQPVVLKKERESVRDELDTEPKIFVYTDRPVYRPEDQVHFKFVHRDHTRGIYQTTPGLEIEVTISDPNGEKLSEKTYRLNEFGTVSDTLLIPKSGCLGIYRIGFKEKAGGKDLWETELFRLEEYKLPEFRVTVKPPEKNGVPETFRSGDKAKIEVGVEYYSGGPVAGAEIEYDLYKDPLSVDNPWPEPCPWLYENFESQAPWMSFWREGGSGSHLLNGKTRTDEKGRAVIEFETEPGEKGWEYRLEANVSDSSRRMVQGEGKVRVTPLPFNFYLRPRTQVVRPGDTATVDVKAWDANSRPQQVAATAVFTREVWVEKSTMSKKTGKSVVTFSGYESMELERRSVQTDAEGNLRLDFKPLASGYYKVKVLSPPVANAGPASKDAAPLERVIGETSLFVADQKTTDLGYRYGALQLFPDKQTYRAGETARVVVIGPESKGAVLLTLEGAGLLDYQVLQMDGSAKMAEFKVTQACEPNIFFHGFMVRNGEALVAMEEAVVPPQEQALNIEVKPDTAQKRSGEKGMQTIRVTDPKGRPVRAELSVGVIDASIYYIAEDSTTDIQQAFQEGKRSHRGEMRSMLNELRVRDLNDEDEVSREREASVATAGGDLYDSADTRSDADFVSASGVTTAPTAMDIAFAVDEAIGPVAVRSDFRSTAFWKPDLITDANGEAKIEFQYPDSLTEWRTTAMAATTGMQFGTGQAEVKTALPVMCRLQTPRFVVEGDQMTLSAVVSNGTDRKLSVQASFDAKNLDPVGKWENSGEIPPGGQKRFDRVFTAKQSGGVAEVTASAKSSAGSDAMKLPLPILEHGLEKFIARSEVLLAGTEPVGMAWNLDLPAARNPGSARLNMVLTPSLASTCLDALPYLADYPYGCVEQTMSRFMPAMIASQALREMKLDPEIVSGRLFGGIDPASASALKMKKGNLEDLDKMLRQGMDRLRDMRHDDAGWGWWKEDRTSDYMTSYVVQGLALGRRAGVQVDEVMMNEGAEYLKRRLVRYEKDPSMQSWLLYAIALSGADWDKLCLKAANQAWDQREKLNSYTRSLLALSFQVRVKADSGYAERARGLVRNLENGVKEEKAESALIGAAGSATMPVTCHWGGDDGSYRWNGGEVEATAFALRAMLAIDPQNKRIDQAARWLINNRRGAQWTNTRDTAIVVMSLLDYIRQTKETSPKLKADLKVNGRVVKSLDFTRENALGTLNIELPDAALQSGANRIELQVQGEGRLYASASLKYFTKEEPILAAGNEIYVKREYYREKPVRTLLGGTRLDKTLLRDGDEIKSGDRIEVRLVLEAKNNYEFLLFEDKKPAGCEAVQLQSGEEMVATAMRADGKFEGASTFVYQELRDTKVAFFITELASGQHEIRYMLRAEVPGKFHALPAMGQAMYAPEIRANSDEMRIVIGDREQK